MSGEDAGAVARRRALDVLVAVAARLAAADRLAPPTDEPALGAIADAAVLAVDVTAASIALHDAGSGRLVFRSAAGPQGEGVVGLSVASNEGIAGYAFSTGQALAIADVAADPRFERATAERTGYLPRSLLAVPLVDDAGVTGVMELLDRRDGRPFDLADMELAGRFAAAATIVARARRVDHDAVRLMRSALGGMVADGAGLDQVSIETLLTAASDGLAVDDPLWRLADRIGRLRQADPDDLELAIDWLDALLARQARRGSAGR